MQCYLRHDKAKLFSSDPHSINRFFDALFISFGKRYARYAGHYLNAQRRQPDPHDLTFFKKKFFLQFGRVETKFSKNRNEPFSVSV